jgi:AcrR family transcriptional regulator
MANEEIRQANIETVLQTTIKLFIENGIQNTTREMIARASGVSRRSTERYFPAKSDCVVQAAEWFGRYLYNKFQSAKMLDDGKYTAAEILESYLGELKKLLFEEPRVYVCYAEFKAYLYRNSENRAADYRKFMDAVGCRQILQRIFELAETDGTLVWQHEPKAHARYLTNTIMGYFSNVVLLYDTRPELMEQYVDTYISDTLNLLRNG